MHASSSRQPVILAAARTPIGRGHPEKGYYAGIHPAALLAATYEAVLEQTEIDAAEVELALVGCVQQFGAQSFNIARNAWLQSGLPIETSATTIDTQCGSGQQAAGFAAALIGSRVHDVIVAGGVEHMGLNSFATGYKIHDEYGTPWTPEYFAQHEVRGQGVGAELIAAEYGVSRAEIDQFALESHQKAAAATRAGLFERELAGVEITGSRIVADQGIREDTSIEALSALAPVFAEDGRITAGSSSQVSDGSAALLIAAAEVAERHGVRPRARIVDTVSVGCDPVKMLEGPIPATRLILERNGLTVGDIDVFEVNEAFAPVVLAFEKTLGVDRARINPRGGAIALGHPLGSTGARLLTTLLHELEDEDKEFGIVTMCCGGGLGTATLIQRV